MTSKDKPFPDDKTAAQRRKGLSKQEIKDLELAGGVEGGMQAGSGGPPPKDDERTGDEQSGKGSPGGDDGKPA